MIDAHRTYIPAARHDWTRPFYDPVVKLLGGNSARAALINHAELQPADLLEDNKESRMLALIASAGFADGRAVRRSKLAGIFHTAYYQATGPQEANHA